jgi:periplasmic divalent cation tolerance protein
MDNDFLIVWCACPDDHSADTIARHLVEQRLAACVTRLGGARSVYRWRSGIERADELVLMIKTRRSRYAELEAAVQALHPYDVPELLATPVVAGAAPYLSWLEESTE